MKPRALTSCAMAILICLAPGAWADDKKPKQVPAQAPAPTPAQSAAGLKAVERTFLERSAIAAADRYCNLFSEGERLALKSGLYQSEGELLRANKDPHELADLQAEVGAHAKSLGCNHPSVTEVAGTVRNSYRQFVKT